MTFGYFAICSAKLSLSCNDFLVKVKYGDQYVLQNFSLLYNNKMYDYREYNFGNEGLEMCASNDSRIRAIWRTRNSWEKFKDRYKCRRSVQKIYARYYSVNKNFTVYLATSSQYFTRNDYGVQDGKLYICKEKFRPISTEYTQEDLLMCNDTIINIEYDDEYKVRTDFSILYKNKVYDYTEYRVLNGGMKICNSTNNYVGNIWKVRNKWVKATMHGKSCNKPIRRSWFSRKYYTVNKQFTLYLAPMSQYFTRHDYGVKYSKPYVCKGKLKPTSTEYTQEDLLMCNDSIINIKYHDEYKVRTDFSILYKNKMYDYTEYRVLNDGIKICNSTNNYVRNIWKARNKMIKATKHRKSCNKPIRTFTFTREYYTVNKQFTIFHAPRSQYFTRNDYGVKYSKPYVCKEKLKTTSTEYTQEDLLMCNDSITNITYDDEYKVRTNFSILYKNKVYDYTEYRVLNDGIKICNSTNNCERNIWKARNKMIKATKHRKSCNKPIRTFRFTREYYTVNKQFTIFHAPRSQYFTRNDYGVKYSKPYVCKEKLKPTSTEYTQEDLLMCNDSITNITYDDEYKVRTNFSILYKNKVYDYTEYRVLNDGIQICNSIDNYVRNIWKVRNKWLKATMHKKSCNKPIRTSSFYRKYYTVNKLQFTVYSAAWSQYFTRNDYGVINGKIYICEEKFRPISTEYNTQEDLLMCNDSIINIKYDDEYKVRTDFSILYKNKVYDYTEYRVLNVSIKICNSTNNYVRNIWKVRNKWLKATMHQKSCNKPIRESWLKRQYYTVNKQFTVYYAARSQFFTRNDYGVEDGKLYICQEKFRYISTEYTQEDLLMCSDSIINIKNDDEYKVRTDFSILYKNKVYNYTEYRVLNDSIKICNSTNNYVRNIWKVRNKWLKATMHQKSCNKPVTVSWLYRKYYTVNKQFTVYSAARSQYFPRNDYGVEDDKPYTCDEKLRPESKEYTQEDLLMCNDPIINITYDDEYKVRTDFSILYKNKVYDYTEYRVLNDSIKICNSTDNYVKNIWKVRNKWVKAKIHQKSCNKPIRESWLKRQYYTVNKQFTVYSAARSQYFPRNDYGVEDGKPFTCDEKLRPESTEYTKEDLLMCNDPIINITYDDEYKVRTDFSILYKNKMYDYTEYRVLNDSIKICNSTDNYVKNIWKVRNKWVKAKIHQKSCNKPIRESWLKRQYYTVNKQFTVYSAARSQFFTTNDYGVEDGKLYICQEKFRYISTEYTQEDLLMCSDSIINIKNDDEYKVRTDFSILYKNKVYNYTEYRVLNDSIKICNSTNNYVRNIWKVRNKWLKATMHQKSCNKPVTVSWLYRKYYTVNKQFTVYSAARSQYFPINDYGVEDGKPYICQEKFRYISTEYTQEDLLMCNDSNINIKYDDEYKVRTDFSILYKNKVYDYTEYRVLNDSIKICNSTDNYVKNIWKVRNKWVKATMHQKSCNKPIRESWLYREYCIVNKQFTVYSAARSQYFTRKEYGVEDGKPSTCDEKLRPESTEYTQEDLLMCNDPIINITYDDEYKVRTDFSILYKNKVYDYTEYRVLNDSIKICNSTDNYVKNIWKVRNKWVKAKIHQKSCNKPIRESWLKRQYYTVNKQFTVYSAARSQYFPRNDYGVEDGKPFTCDEKLRPESTEYTKEDLLMCNDPIINITYDDEYQVRTDFSILYKNKVYNYTEYRVLNDSIKNCNSTNNYVRNIWKVRNKWLKATMHQKSCNKPVTVSWLYRKYYTVNKQFTVYSAARSQYFPINDYGVEDGKPYICQEKFRYISTEYTQEDLLMCNDSNINIKYDDEYKVRTDFSILYKNKVYDYTEYRVLNDSIKICNSTDNYVKNIWKVLNKWVKAKIHQKSCNKPIRESWLKRQYYTVNKQFTVYSAARSQYFPRNDYGVEDGKPYTCDEKLRPESTEYTREDLLMCNDPIINITYDDEYQVRTDFSILYKNKVYDYTEYRVLNDGIKICNSTDNYVRDIWKVRNKWVKEKIHQKSCNKPIRESWLYREYCIVNKQFTVYSAARSQYFTRKEYGVEDGKPSTCDEKFRPESTEYTKEDLLMCNDSIINITYDDEYKVWTDFSILYKNKLYNYTEYRVLNDSIKVCNSTDNYVQNIWKLRNDWVKGTIDEKSCNKPVTYIDFDRWEYTVLKDFRVRILATKQLITKYDYGVDEGKLMTCVTECAKFTFTIKYEDEYRVWNNFSMMYQGRMYSYDEYRLTDDGLQVCNSSDRLIKEKWRNFIVWVMITVPFYQCNVRVDGFYSENYTLHTNFTVFFKPTNQNFTWQDYGVILGYFAICSSQLTLSCNDDLVKVKYDEQYNVYKNFSLVYNDKIYDYREYRLSHDSLEMCGSSDSRVQAIWRTRNSWQKSLPASCYRSYKLNARYYTVTKQFAVYSADNGQYFERNDYAVIDGKPYVCGKENLRPIYVITNFKIIIAPLCALALSIISLLLLLIVYCMLPELRTLPGLNLMSFSFALLLWQTYLAVFLSLYSHVGKLFEIPCARLFVANKFMTYSIIMNAAVNIYHLRKTFCGNTLVKSDELKTWNRFLKYSFFSWGVPVIITIVYLVLIKEDVLRFDGPVASVKKDVQSSLRFYRRIVNGKTTTNNIRIYHRVASLKGDILQSKSNQSTALGKEDATEDDARIYQPIVSLKKDVQSSLKFYERIVFANGNGKEDDARIYQQISGDCINGRITPDWSADVDIYGIQGCLLLYITGMFIFTAYRIRQKLKASRNIAQKSNVVKRRKFVILLKLSTTTALSYWFPLFISRIVDFDFDIKIALYTVTLLTGAYIGIAFVFTRRNYQLLKKKYFPANNKPPVNEIPLNRL